MLALSLWLLCVACLDWRWRRVPNTVVVAGAMLVVLCLLFGVHPLRVSAIDAAIAFIAGFALLLPFYALKLMGAADVKFAAALGLWLGPWPLLSVWIGASILAGLHGLALLAWRRYTGVSQSRKREIPYAAHMAVVALGGLLWQHKLF
ncbi:A24 family peptidase [Xenophilus arseniciresistens]|uniref:A24 family peptidase n=1 Tax=Xenophilus arseniciresistens TaxID=1283306 RepID=A0AAE3NB98_9BURK|nr:A24 family peptidase [Xenophilus arseniciresistens]MDA7418178.1 A24 family peptidase [Xenophilus arseniciresistens]